MVKASLRDTHKLNTYNTPLIVIGVIIMFINIVYVYPIFADDSFISLRYAARLVAGHGLTWNDGEYVEGYSNFAWLLLCAFLQFLGIDGIWSARIPGFIFSIATLVMLVHALSRLTPDATWRWLLVLLFALTPSVATWAIAGLEQPMVMFLLLLAYLWLPSNKPPFAAGIVMGLMVITRPDSPLLVAGLAAGYLWQHGLARSNIIRISWILFFPIIFWICHLIFRVTYYNDFFPNTAYLKVEPSISRFFQGIIYLYYAARAFFFILLIISILLIKNCFSLPPAVKAALPLLASWVVYVGGVGGDHFAAYRVLLPLIPIVFVCAGAYPSPLPHRISHSSAVRKSFFIITICVFFIITNFANDFLYTQVKIGRWPWQYKLIAAHTQVVCQGHTPVIAVFTAGTIPYFTNYPTIDMLGVNDRHIARTRPVSETAMLGHDRADIPYVLAKKPDLIFLDKAELGFPAEALLLANTQFHAEYTLVTFDLEMTPERQQLIPQEWLPIPSDIGEKRVWRQAPVGVRIAVRKGGVYEQLYRDSGLL